MSSFFGFVPHPSVFRAYSRLCTQWSLLALIRDHVWCWEWNPGWPHARPDSPSAVLSLKSLGKKKQHLKLYKGIKFHQKLYEVNMCGKYNYIIMHNLWCIIWKCVTNRRKHTCLHSNLLLICIIICIHIIICIKSL